MHLGKRGPRPKRSSSSLALGRSSGSSVACNPIGGPRIGSLNERFEGLNSAIGRPSIPPEMFLRAMLLQAFFSVRSERILMKQINYNLLFRWFVGLPIDAEVWHPTVFTHNRDRLIS
jgi:hypothetical protein